MPCRQEEESSLQPCSQQHTFQLRLLIELPAGAKFSTGAYSYQPYNTAELFKTCSRGTLPEEQHARGQIKLDGWQENGNPAQNPGAGSYDGEYRAQRPLPACPSLIPAADRSSTSQGLTALSREENNLRYCFKTNLAPYISI